MFTGKWHNFKPKYIHAKVPNSLPFPKKPNGSTSFKVALNRAAYLINKYYRHHTCFLLVTDGEAGYSGSAVKNFNKAKKRVQKNCLFCSGCYFIQEKVTTKVPKNFKRI